jgi:hypothetical protein
MSRKDIKQNPIMTVADLKNLLDCFVRQRDIGNDSQIWLSSDEEGNEFLPMLRNPKLSLAFDKDTKRIIFFPSHR